MYRVKCGGDKVDSYIEAGGKGYRNFKIQVEFISKYLVNNVGWMPSSKVNYKTEGETILYKLDGDSITLKDDGIHITYDDGHWKWFTFKSFMNNLKLYRKLMLRFGFVVKFFEENKDEW